MAKSPEMPLDTDAYLADTGHLSTFEHGIYLLLLMAMWRSPAGWLPSDDLSLARAAHTSVDKWRRAAPTIRALLREQSGKVSQKKLLKTRPKTSSQNPSQNPSQSPGIEPKPLKNKEAGANSAVEAENAPLLLLTTEELESKKKKKSKGGVLPADWRPRPEERAYGRSLGLSETQIDRAAEKMRRWAITNAHRQVARKSNWDLTFRNWLDGDAERITKPGGWDGSAYEVGSVAIGRSAAPHADALVAGMGRVAARRHAERESARREVDEVAGRADSVEDVDAGTERAPRLAGLS